MQYVALSKRGGSYRVERAIDAAYDMGDGGTAGEVLSSQVLIENNLKELRKLVGKKWAGKVYAAIQSKDVLLRTVDLPNMGISDIKDAFKYEFDKFFPIPVDEAVYDIAVIDRPDKDEATKGAIAYCIATAVRRSAVENLMIASQKANLRFAALEPSPVSVLRCLMGPSAPSGFNVYALAGIMSSMIIATYKDNGVVYRNTAQSFVLDDPQGRMIENFTRDLQATVNFASTQMRGFSPGGIYIGGHGAKLGKKLISSVSSVTSAPVFLVDPWDLWSIDNKPDDRFGWEIALGLALRPAEVK